MIAQDGLGYGSLQRPQGNPAHSWVWVNHASTTVWDSKLSFGTGRGRMDLPSLGSWKLCQDSPQQAGYSDFVDSSWWIVRRSKKIWSSCMPSRETPPLCFWTSRLTIWYCDHWVLTLLKIPRRPSSLSPTIVISLMHYQQCEFSELDRAGLTE